LFPLQTTTGTSTSIKMGLGDDIKEFEKDATGQGGNDGQNNATNSNRGNDKTEDALADSGTIPLFLLGQFYIPPIFRTYRITSWSKTESINSGKPHANPLPTAIDQFASKEGVLAGMDPEINNVVNDEINKL